MRLEIQEVGGQPQIQQQPALLPLGGHAKSLLVQGKGGDRERVRETETVRYTTVE